MKKLSQLSTQELLDNLNFTERLLSAYTKMNSEMNQLIKEGVLTNAECAVHLQSLGKGLVELENITDKIEAVLDNRIKKDLSITASTRTLKGISDVLGKLVKERMEEFEKGTKPEQDPNAPMKLT